MPRVVGNARVVVDAALEAEPITLIVDQIAPALEQAPNRKIFTLNPVVGRDKNAANANTGDNVSEYMFYINRRKSVPADMTLAGDASVQPRRSC